MKKVLFVCTGNTCRSPMAAGIFNHKIRQLEKGNAFIGHSAGVFAMDNEGASKHAVEALRQMGMDISQHKARLVTEELLKDAQFVFTMTTGHKGELMRRFPHYADKTFTLYEFVEEDFYRNVEDPYGAGLDVYSSCAMELRKTIEKLVEKLIG